MMKKHNEQHKKADLNFDDRPINNKRQDKFDFETKMVTKIHDFLTDEQISPLTVAITGEWGMGKTSVINLLCNRLESENKNILIHFEPSLEGRFGILEIIELFYLKLYSNQHIKSDKLKKTINKSLKSVLLLARCKLSAELPLPYINVGVNYDLGRNIKDMLKLWDSNDGQQSFAEQTKNLDKALVENSYKLYVIIDEIDRLTAQHIINFLLFARILESFSNLTCIIGIDYKQVVEKLINEGHLGLCNYASAKAYLEKLFQIKFHVHINTDEKIKFAIEKMESLGVTAHPLP